MVVPEGVISKSLEILEGVYGYLTCSILSLMAKSSCGPC